MEDSLFKRINCGRWLRLSLSVLLMIFIGQSTVAAFFSRDYSLDLLDTSVDPCENFYQYACGNWINEQVIPPGKDKFTAYDEGTLNVKLQLKGLLERPYRWRRESLAIKKVKNLYRSCVHKEKRNEKGGKPLMNLVKQLGKWPLIPRSYGPSDIETVLANVGLLHLYPLILVDVSKDFWTRQNMIWISASRYRAAWIPKGRDSPEAAKHELWLRSLAEHILRMRPSQELDSVIRDVVDFQYDMSQIFAPGRKYGKAFTYMNISDINAKYPGIDWTKFLLTFYHGAKASNVTETTEVLLFYDGYIESFLDLYNNTDKRTVFNVILMSILTEFADELSDDIRHLKNPEEELPPLWETCVDEIRKDYMPLAIGQLYVKNYFSRPYVKEEAEELASFIQNSLKDMIQDSFMDNKTKIAAAKRVDRYTLNMGYPVYQFNATVVDDAYKHLDYDRRSKFFDYSVQSSRSKVYMDAAQLEDPGLKITDYKWYSSAANDQIIVYSSSWEFPAAYLRNMNDEDYPWAMRFGSYGSHISFFLAKEVFSYKAGWTNSSKDEYSRKKSCFVDQYSRESFFGHMINGISTADINMYDNIGLQAAYKAYKQHQTERGQTVLPAEIPKQDQFFFIAYAQNFCKLLSNEKKLALLDEPYSPPSIRVDQSVANLKDFAEAFSCSASSKLNVGENRICKLM